MSRDNSISREPQKIEISSWAHNAYCSAHMSESFDKLFITRSTILGPTALETLTGNKHTYHLKE